MKNATSFYNWFQILGGNLANLEVGNLVSKLNNPSLFISSFKNRPEEIKEKYNYKFKN